MSKVSSMNSSHWRPWDHADGGPQFMEQNIRMSAEIHVPRPVYGGDSHHRHSAVITSPEQQVETGSSGHYQESWQHESRHSISSGHAIMITTPIITESPRFESSPHLNQTEAEAFHHSPPHRHHRTSSTSEDGYNYHHQSQRYHSRPHPYYHPHASPPQYLQSNSSVDNIRLRSVSAPIPLRSPMCSGVPTGDAEYYPTQASPSMQSSMNGHLYPNHHSSSHHHHHHHQPWEGSSPQSYDDRWTERPHHGGPPPPTVPVRLAPHPSSNVPSRFADNSSNDHHSAHTWPSNNSHHNLRQPHSNTSNESSSNHSNRRKKPPISRPDRPCLHCGTHESCTWRPGPTGSGTLCNTCGYFYRRHGRLNAKRKSLLANSQDNASHVSVTSATSKLAE